MNSLLLKSLLSALMLSKAPVEPICVSIDTYTNDQDTIYLLGNVPVGTPELLKQELTDFIQAVKSKHDAYTYVIAQDLSYYNGENNEVKQYMNTNYGDDHVKRYGIILERPHKGRAPSGEIFRDSALRNLATLCNEHNIPFFNAECRHEMLYNQMYNPDAMAAEFQLIVDTLDHVKLLKKFYDIDFKDPKALDIPHVDVRILRGLHDLIQPKRHNLGFLHKFYTTLLDLMPESKQKEKGSWSIQPKRNDNNHKNIFVFADLKHIYRIVSILEKHLNCAKNTSHAHKDYSIDRHSAKERQQDEETDLIIQSNFVLDQQKAQQYIDKHQVNIADYFAEEK